MTGPTGSGKTTTLYAALNELNRPDVKIITAEDPVEYYLPGINQCEVKAKIGMTFARIIRAMLRQNPNILLVGEIRDEETANTAIQASLTGHLVFSTLHTNDAPSALTRLVDIGVQPFLVASSIIGIMGQRLVRKVCPKCQAKYEPPAHLLKTLGIRPEIASKANFMRGKGCSHCNKTGYRGRHGDLRADDHDQPDPRDDLQGRVDAGDPQGGPETGDAHAVRGRDDQGPQGPAPPSTRCSGSPTTKSAG